MTQIKKFFNRYSASFLFISIFLFSSLHASELKLTPEEKRWLASHKRIKMGIDRGYGPYSFVDEKGAPQGAVMDYLKEIEKLLGVHFEIVSNLSWTQLIEAIKAHKIDAIATVKRMPERELFLNFSQMYLYTPLTVMTRYETPELKTIDELQALRLCLVKGYSSSKEVMARFPNLKPVYVSEPVECLKAVSQGRSDAYIGVLGVNSFMATKAGLYNLKYNVAMDMQKNGQSFGVRKDWPMLAEILDKALDVIPEEEKQKILQRWLPLQMNEIKRLGKQDFISEIYPWLIGILFIALVGYLLMLLWNYELKKELQRRKEELERAQRVAHIGDWSFDLEHQKMHWSDELFRSVGQNPTPSNTLSWDRVCSWLHADNRQKSQQFIDTLCQSKPGDTFPSHTTQFVKPDGDLCWMEITAAVEYDKSGRAVSCYGTALDVTERKIAAEKLHEKEEIMIAQSRHAAMGEMISMIAHQWRQPVSVIAMAANNVLVDIELQTLKMDELRKSMQEIVDETQEVSKIINDFRNFFKPGKNVERVWVESIVSDTLEVVGKSLANSNIEVVKNFDEHQQITTYSRELMQVFMNLINNAKEALVESGTKDGRIVIEIKNREDEVVIKVSDNAGGMQPELLDRIFEPYFSTKHEKNGTGLGLYISKTIIEKHLNGTIRATNSDTGALFVIRLPYVLEIAHESRKEEFQAQRLYLLSKEKLR